MKLNYKRTILVGFAFFLICTFWQAYDTIIPKILTDKFGMTQTLSGIIMALDNILALFLLPFFGGLSDKCKSKMGRRKPYVLVGTIIAVIAFFALAAVDYMQIDKNIKSVTEINTLSLAEVYDKVGDQELKTADGEIYTLKEKYPDQTNPETGETLTGREVFSKIYAKSVLTDENGKVRHYGDGVDDEYGKDDPYGRNGERVYVSNEEYLKYVVPARQAANPEALKAMQEIYAHQGEGQSDNWFVKNILRGGRDPQTPDGVNFKLTEKYPTEEAFLTEFAQINIFDPTVTDPEKQISFKTNPDYIDYVVPARQAYVWNITIANPGVLIAFIAVLLIVLIGMSIFRSPAVALMPDVTIKPLRSKANAVINLMGSAGGVCALVLGLGMFFNTGAISNTFMNVIGFFGAIIIIMLITLVVFMLTVKEPKWAAEMEQTSRELGIEEADDTEAVSGEKKLSKGEKISLLLILASVVLWFMGYNAVSSKYSIYASRVLDKDYNLTLIIAQAAAIISYLPIGFLSSKIGRKKAILIGVVILTGTFFGASFMRSTTPTMLMNVMFTLAGIGWATINVNSFPMVVELCKGGNVGKYTGYYYAASMAAQAVTPFLSGMFMDRLGFTSLFPYATIAAGLAFFTMLFVKHGDSKPIRKKGLEALDVDD
ncbi:MAG: MFS transporter [Clostridia bacterium]|nr:MFS transporter [Clostridia bacterium]